MKAQILTLAASAMITVSASPVLADEAWSVDGMTMYYEADLDNGMAVLSVPGEGKFFIQDLAGVYEGRGSYDGIWIAAEDYSSCDIAIVNPQTGEQSYSWGRVRMVFIDPDFPSRWVALGGECMEDPDEDPIVAMPLTGDDVIPPEDF